MKYLGFGGGAAVWAGVAVLYAIAVFILGSTAPSRSGAAFNDKLAHLVVFGGQYLLVARAAAAAGAARRGQILTGLAVALGLGAGLELWQAQLPYRSAELLDLVADAAGACTGVVAEEIVRRVRRRTA